MIKQIFCAVSFIIVTASFILQPEKGVRMYELQPNETIPFNSEPSLSLDSFMASYERGSFDRSSYSIKVDRKGHLEISHVRSSRGSHQNEIALYNCSGKIMRVSDTIKISTKTPYHKFYIFNLRKNAVVDSLSSEVEIVLVAKTEKGEYCPILANTSMSNWLVALPRTIETKEIFKSKHKTNTIGTFKYFCVKDNESKSKYYSEGDYVLVGGNSAILLK